MRRLTFALLILVGASSQAASQTRGASQPTLPSAVRAACDMAFAIARATPGVSIRRRTGTFHDETLHEPVFGCGLAISGSFKRAEKTGDAAIRLRDAFMAQDWTEMPAYGADGEPALPAEDWYKVAMFCTSPAFPQTR